MPSCGDEQAEGFLGGDDLGVCAEHLVAPDVVVVPVAIDDRVGGAAGQGLTLANATLSPSKTFISRPSCSR